MNRKFFYQNPSSINSEASKNAIFWQYLSKKTTNELNGQTTTEEFSVVQQEGGREVTRSRKFYNLDAIISVGYRVNSRRASLTKEWIFPKWKYPLR